MEKQFNLKAEIYVDREIEKDLLMQKFAIGIYKEEKNRDQLPLDWQCFAQSEEENGFYGEAYVKNGQVVIAFRGTELEDRGDLSSDKEVFMKKIPAQAESALKFYYQVEELCDKYGYDKKNITITGHSLGGINTQIVCAITGAEGVTFNSHGVRDIIEKTNLKINNSKQNVRNYGNIHDMTFYLNIKNFIGKTFVIDTNPKEIMIRPLKYHRIEYMGDIRDAEPYDANKHNKFEKSSIEKTLSLEDVIKQEEKTQKTAFEHAYAQAKSAFFGSNEGNDKNHYGQSDNEENMDKWNSHVGREIGNKIRQKFKSIRNYFSDEQIEDFIAHEVMVRMNAGDLITHPDDPRKFKDYEKIKKRKEELLNTRTISNYQRQSVPIELLKNKKGFYAGFVNTENGSDRIYSIEDVGGMTDECRQKNIERDVMVI